MATYQYKVQTSKGPYGFETQYGPDQTSQLQASFQKVFGIAPVSFAVNPFTLQGGKAVFGPAAAAPAPQPAYTPQPAQYPEPAPPTLADLGPSATQFTEAQSRTQTEETGRILEPYRQGLGEYVEALGRQASPLDLYRQFEEEAGVPGLRRTVEGLRGEVFKVEDLLSTLEKDIMARTERLDVSEAARRRIEAFEGEPLREQLTGLTTGLGREETVLSEAMGRAGMLTGYGVEAERQKLAPYTAKLEGEKYIGGIEIGTLSDRLAREMTGFTEDRQAQLELIMDKVTRGRQLSDREWQQARDLEAEAREFERQKQIIRLEASTRASSENRITPYQQAQLDLAREELGQGRQNTLSDTARSYIPDGGWTAYDQPTWASSWNSLKAQFPEASNANIDAALGIAGGSYAAEAPWNNPQAQKKWYEFWK